jgi:hypothetical protein
MKVLTHPEAIQEPHNIYRSTSSEEKMLLLPKGLGADLGTVVSDQIFEEKYSPSTLI